MDPYKVLGVSYDATDEEIKSAYKKLSRLYHPDANVGKPNQAELEEKFKEVQQAYQMIQDRKKRQEEDPWSNFYSQYQEQPEATSQYVRAAINYIDNGYYKEGLNVLDQIPENQRDGEWYYVSAVANYKVGNNGIALEHAKCACALDPGNMFYRNFLNNLSGGGARYQQSAMNYGYSGGKNINMGTCNPCLAIMAANMCCMGFGAPVILCC